MGQCLPLGCKGSLPRACGGGGAGLRVWDPGGGGGKRPGPGVGVGVRREQCPELGSSVRCSVQPCGGQCPVQCPRWAAVQAPGRVVSGRVSGGRGPGRARCAPCSPRTGALGTRAQRRDPASPTPSPPGRPPLLSLLPSLQGRVQFSSQPPLSNPRTWRRARPPIKLLKPRRVASCASGLVTAGRGRAIGREGAVLC